MQNVARQFLSSASAATVSQLWRIGVTFLTHVALRYLIPPEQLGLWNWVDPLFFTLAQLRDLGVNGQVVRDKRRPFGNFLQLELLWGGIFTALVFFGAPFLSRLYEDHSVPVEAVIRTMCIFLFVHGLGMVPTIFFEVELKVLRTVKAEILRNTVFAVVSLSLAFNGYGVWSAIVGHVVASSLYTLLIWIEAWREITLHRIPETWKLVKSSLPLMAMSMLEQTVLRIDYFILALHFPTAVVAFAGLAWQAVFFFSRMLADSVGRSLYPALVRYGDEPRRAFDAYRVATVFMMSLSVPLAFFLFGNAELVVQILGGKGWEGAAVYLRWLALVPLARPFTMFAIELLLTLHLDRWLLASTLVNLISVGGLGLFLTQTSLGPRGMALAGFFPLGMLVFLWAIRKAAGPILGKLFRQLAELELVGLLLFLPLYFLAPGDRIYLRFALFCAAGLVYLGYAWWRNAAMFRRFIGGEL
jgi:O-antigen/teichoic acid export membrane protein